MNGNPAGTRTLVITASVAAGAMIAQQVGGKATRDALFLSQYDVTSLPLMIMVAAATSILTAFLATRLLSTWGPGRTAFWGFISSAVLLWGEWGLTLAVPRVAAVVVYFHTVVIGSLVISWYWSLINERFDPRTARQNMGRITGGATLGGLVGGILAERLGAVASVATMLPVLGLFHAITAVLIWRLRPAGAGTLPKTPRPETGASDPRFGLRVLRETPYLRQLAVLVGLGTMSAVMLDYVFKVEATAALSGGESLMRFFAVYYTVISVATFLVQTSLSKAALEKLGLGGTAASLPGAMLAGGVLAFIVPGFGSIIVARGTEAALRSSLFRSAYELFYTPLAKARKRATKTLIDVGFDRLGDAAGAGLIKLLLVMTPFAPRNVLLFLVMALAVMSLLILRRLQRGYVKTLEQSLMHRAMELDMDSVTDSTTRMTLMQSISRLDLDSQLLARLPDKSPVPEETKIPAATDAAVDPLVRNIMRLRSGDTNQVVAVLRSGSGLSPELVPHVIRLLAWDEVAPEAIRALTPAAPGHIGQLSDALLDPDEPFAVRRRIPRILAACPTARSATALFSGLDDSRFEVRFQCGRALARLLGDGVSVSATRAEIFAAAEREVQVDRRVWESRRLLEQADDARESVFVDKFLRKRADRSLEHVFTVLSLTLPAKPLRVAYRGLHTDDNLLRGTALEYLESVLPSGLRDRLWPFLEQSETKRESSRTREEILDDLLRSNKSIQINLEALRDKQ